MIHNQEAENLFGASVWAAADGRVRSQGEVSTERARLYLVRLSVADLAHSRELVPELLSTVEGEVLMSHLMEIGDHPHFPVSSGYEVTLVLASDLGRRSLWPEWQYGPFVSVSRGFSDRWLMRELHYPKPFKRRDARHLTARLAKAVELSQTEAHAVIDGLIGRTLDKKYAPRICRHMSFSHAWGLLAGVAKGVDQYRELLKETPLDGYDHVERELRVRLLSARDTVAEVETAARAILDAR